MGYAISGAYFDLAARALKEHGYPSDLLQGVIVMADSTIHCITSVEDETPRIILRDNGKTRVVDSDLTRTYNEKRAEARRLDAERKATLTRHTLARRTEVLALLKTNQLKEVERILDLQKRIQEPWYWECVAELHRLRGEDEAKREALFMYEAVGYRRFQLRETYSVKIGERLENLHVGECWVKKIEGEFLVVEYEGFHFASGETRRYERSDLYAFFWRLPTE